MKKSRKSFSALLASVMLASVCSGETITVTQDGAAGEAVPPFTGAIDLVKNGDGTFTLTGSNTYTGTTHINAGTLKVAASYGLTETSRIYVASGAILDFGASNALGVGTDNPPNIELNGGTLQTSFNGHVNLGNLRLNGGQIYSSQTSSDYGNYLLAGTATVTADTSINCSKILIRSASQQCGNGTAGKFIVNAGSTLTLNTTVNFKDLNYDGKEYAHWDISGGGTITMMKAAAGVAGTRITVSGSGTTLDFAANNIWSSGKASMANFTINEGARINHSASSKHTNIGNLTLNGGSLTAVNLSNGSRVTPSGYGNYLVCGAITVLSDSEISADTYFRDRNTNPTSGNISIAEGAALTVSGTLNFAGGSNSSQNNESGKLFISGGGTLIVPTGGGCKFADPNKNTITVQGEGTTLQFGNGGNSGWWAVPVILEDGATLEMNRGSVGGNFALPITTSNGILTNEGPCTVSFSSPITVQESEAEANLTVKGTSQINFTNGTLTGTGTVLKTGTNTLSVVGANDFAGEILVQEGTLNISVSNGLGTGKIILDGGTLQNSGAAGKIALPNDWEVRSDSAINAINQTLLLTGKMTGSATLTKTGNSQLHIWGDASEFAGKVVSTANWLSFQPQGVSVDARYVLSDAASGIVLVPTSENPETDTFSFGMLESTTANAAFRPGGDAVNAGIKNIYAEIGGSGMSGTYTGQIQDYQGTVMHLDKVGSGTWIFTGNHSSNGTFSVSEGTLQFGAKDDSAQAKTIQLNEGGTLTSGHWNSTIQKLVFNGGSVGVSDTPSHLNVQTAEAVEGTSSEITMANTRLFINEGLSGSGTLTLNGNYGATTNNQLQIKGDCSNFSGTLIVNAAFAGLFDAASASPNAIYQFQTNAGLFLVTSADDSGIYELGELSSNSGSVEVRAGNDNRKNPTLKVGGANTNAEFAGIIRDNPQPACPNTISVVKTGTGTWTLSGKNTYAGTTTVEDGTLNVTGSITSDTSVLSGASLAGTGTIDGNLMFSGGTYLVDLTQATVLEQVLNGDLLDVTGSLSAENDTLVLELIADANLLNSFTENEKYSVLNVESPEDQFLEVSLNLIDAAGNWIAGFDSQAGSLWISLEGGGGEPVSPSVPEPSTFVLLFGALGFFALKAARKRS